MESPTNTSEQQTGLYEIKEALYTLLLNNSGIKEIVKSVHRYLNNAITICNSSYSVIANYPENEYTESLENQNGTLYLPLMDLRTMQEEKLMERIFEAQQAFFFETKHSNYHMLFCPIRIRKAVNGYICVRDTNRNFNHLDLSIVDSLSGILSLEMQKYDFYSSSYETRFEYLLGDLIEKPMDNPEYFKERFKQLGRPLLSHCWIMIIASTTETNLSSSKINDWQNQLQVIFPTALVTYYNQHLTLLITKKSFQPFSESEERKLKNFLHFNCLVGGLSYCCTNLFKLRDYYNQAYKLLHAPFAFSETSQTKQPILYYENEVTTTLLSYCNDPHFLLASVHPDLLFLLDYDQQHNSKLFATLRVYLEQNRNAINASRALHIHKSTFFYRLNKILELLDGSLDDYGRLYNYELSLQILDYLNSTKKTF